jgi:hypothetical protein
VWSKDSVLLTYFIRERIDGRVLETQSARDTKKNRKNFPN